MLEIRLAIVLALLAIPAAAWTESRIAPGTAQQFNPLIAVDDAGMMHAIWAETRLNGTMNQRVYYASGDGATWSAPTMLRDVRTDQLPGGIGIVGGKLFAAVDHYTLENQKTTEYLLREGGSWKSVGTDNSLCALSVVSGRAYKAWISGGTLYSASSADASAWTAPLRVADTANCTKVFFGETATYAAYLNGTNLVASGSSTPVFQTISRFVLSFSGFVDAGGALNLLVSHTNANTDYLTMAGGGVSVSYVTDYPSLGGLLLQDENGTRHAILFTPAGDIAYAWSKNLRNWFAGERPPVPLSRDQVYFAEKKGTLYLSWIDWRFGKGAEPGNAQVFVATAPVRTETAANLRAEMYAEESRALFGTNVTLYVTVSNAGTEDVAESIHAAVFLDGNETQNVTIPPLAIAGSYRTAVSVGAVREGNITVRVVADPDGLVRESTKADNAAEVVLEVLKARCASDGECAYGQYCSGGKCAECTSCEAAACSDYLSCRKPLPPVQPAQAGDNTMTIMLVALAGAAAGILLFLWRRRR